MKKRCCQKRAKKTDFSYFISEKAQKHPFRKFRSIVDFAINCNKSEILQPDFAISAGFPKAGCLATRTRVALIGRRLRWQFASDFFLAVSLFCRKLLILLIESHGRVVRTLFTHGRVVHAVFYISYLKNASYVEFREEESTAGGRGQLKFGTSL